MDWARVRKWASAWRLGLQARPFLREGGPHIPSEEAGSAARLAGTEGREVSFVVSGETPPA